MTNFVYTRKNFPDVQKLSGRQCRHADEVFWTLASMYPTIISEITGDHGDHGDNDDFRPEFLGD